MTRVYQPGMIFPLKKEIIKPEFFMVLVLLFLSYSRDFSRAKKKDDKVICSKMIEQHLA